MANRQAVHVDGIIPIIPTPFTPDEQIDFKSLRRLLDFAASIDVCGVCLPAYASEFYKLSEEERRQLIAAAIEHIGARKPVVAQANAASAVNAAALARFAQEQGASAVAVAVPRLFAVSENDLLRYFDRILSAIDVPLLIQDVNPGGSTVSPEFVARLHQQHTHFRWVKLEEPMMASRVAAIADATSGQVGVLEGWGGMYLLELIKAGVCGVMPGLGVSDLLARIFRLACHGQKQEAYEVFQGVLPQITFSLQNMEFYHFAEKRLLEARGIIEGSAIRDLRICPFGSDAEHVDFLNGNILSLLDRLGMPHNQMRG